MRRAVLAMLVLGGCARGGAGGGGDDGGDDGPATPDAAPSSDACVTMTTQLLANPKLDDAPQGTGWMEQRIQANAPLITSQDGSGVPVEHSAPYKIWLGGFNGGTDVLSQDVAIPPRTTMLVLSGVYDVRTTESTSSRVFDSVSVSVTQVAGAPLEAVLALSNLSKKTAWTPFQYMFTQDLSGQTVRLRFSSISDSTYATSFFFDSLELTATQGCP